MAAPLRAEYAALRCSLIEAKRASYLGGGHDLPEAHVVRAECDAFTAALVKAFPHLRHANGFYCGQEHHWAVEPDGAIVDLTWQQFGPLQDVGSYREFDALRDQVFLGRCMNCGEDIRGLIALGRQMVCGPECEAELEEYFSELGQ